MNAKNVPGFTAENTIFKAWTPYRTGGVFDSQNGPTYVQPARDNLACLYLWKVGYGIPPSIQTIVSRAAYDIACG